MSRRKMLSLSALALSAYLAGHRQGVVEGEVRGGTRVLSSLVRAAVDGLRGE